MPAAPREPSAGPASSDELPPDPDRVVVVHYECEDFEDTIGDPRPTAIVLRDTATGAVVRVFNDEEALLYSALSDALRARAWEHVVTWSMGDAGRFGWAALARRASTVGIALSAPGPHLDLANWLWRKYGNDYVPHGERGRLFELAKLNNQPTRGWDAGSKEGPAAGTTAQRVRRCEVKTAAIEGLLRLEFSGSLRIGANSGTAVARGMARNLAEAVRVALDRVERFFDIIATDTRQPDPLYPPHFLGAGAAERYSRARRSYAEAMLDLERSLETAGRQVDPDDRSRIRDSVDAWKATDHSLPHDHEFTVDDPVPMDGMQAHRRVRKLLRVVVRGLPASSALPGSPEGATTTAATSPPDPTEEGDPREALVTLDQAAAVAGVHKRTLERMKDRGELPEPYRSGGQGRAALWMWNELRPAIEPIARHILPKIFPTGPR